MKRRLSFVITAKAPSGSLIWPVLGQRSEAGGFPDPGILILASACFRERWGTFVSLLTTGAMEKLVFQNGMLLPVRETQSLTDWYQ